MMTTTAANPPTNVKASAHVCGRQEGVGASCLRALRGIGTGASIASGSALFMWH